MPTNLTILLIVLFVLIVCLAPNGAYAFGAGNIPSFAYMEDRAFRHGDIEDVLSSLVKGAGGGMIASMLSKGTKFNGLDIKRIYFGNWLRDYSQAVDIAGLSKLQLQSIINLCMVLGFMAHGYATNEFEVTVDRLGVYLPTEHIDNPKGYGEGQDARSYDRRLRGPVDPRELDVDPRTGMKNYIANESGGWDTSKAVVRRTLEQCIHLGRQHRANGRKQDLYEAYRLLGQAMHTLEDFPAHSNFCELTLVNMGHQDVFCHVGDQVRLQAPNGKWVPPIITGTFGSDDFIHSLLGEATDHLSEASVTDINKAMDKARSTQDRSGPGGSANVLRDLFFSIPGGDGAELSREMENVERIRAAPSQGGKPPDQMSPQELHAVLWQVLSFRDSVAKKISKTIEKIPGLGPLIEKLTDSISVFVFTTLEPFLKPLLKTATDGLQSASGQVINKIDQFEVFNDPRASDPTHSFLSKDHFNLILNEPAGKVAKAIVIYTVNAVVKAWDEPSINVHHLTEDILECLFHPDFHNHNSKIQREMLQVVRDWVQGLGHKQHEILKRLTKQAVRNHENVRLAGEGGQAAAQGSYAQTQGIEMQHTISNYAQQLPGVSQGMHLLDSITGGGAGTRREGPGDSGYGGGGMHQSYQPPSGPPPSVSGEAAGYYGGGGGGGSYAPPSGPPPSFPGGEPGYGGHHSGHHGGGQQGGYNPSYSSPPAPSFPGSEPSFPSEHHHGGGHHSGGYNNQSYGAPPTGFPDPDAGGYGMPSAAPGFPGEDNYQQQGHHHSGGHHQHHHQSHHPSFPQEDAPYRPNY